MERHPVYRALNKPLTVLGVERRLFFFVLTVSFSLFQISTALLPAVTLFCILVLAARVATKADPQILRVVLNSARFVPRYDPAKPGVLE